MQCRQCGMQIPNTAKFCIYCGAASQPAELKITEPTLPPNGNSNYPQAGGQPARQPMSPGPALAYPPQPGAVYGAQPTQPNTPYPGASAGQPARVREQEEPAGPVMQRKAPFGLRLLSVVLCVLVVIVGLCTTLLAAFRWSFNPDALTELVYDLDPEEIRMPNENGDSITLAEFIDAQSEVDIEKEYGITHEELTRVISAPFVKNFVGSVLSDYADYFLNDAPLQPLTRDRVVDFLRENDYEIQRLTGYSFRDYEQDYNYYSDRYNEEYDLDSVFEAVGSRNIDPAFLESKLGVDLGLVKFLLSGLLLALLIILSVILLVLIFLTLRRYMRSAMTRSGVSLVVLGGLDVVLGGGGMAALAITKLGIASAIVNPMLSKLLILGGILLVLGIVLILLRRAFRKPVKETL